MSGLTLFLLASLGCGLAPSLALLVFARFVQGSAAALMMPSSMALIRHAYADPRRTRAVGVWAMGGAVASSSGPVLGGVLTELNWRLIFLINVPVGLVALLLLRRAGCSPVRDAPLDWAGQLTAVVAMGGLTYGAIEAGVAGFTRWPVLLAFGISLLAVVAFVVSQARVRHPMVPPHLLANRSVRIAVVTGFAFMSATTGCRSGSACTCSSTAGCPPWGPGRCFCR